MLYSFTLLDTEDIIFDLISSIVISTSSTTLFIRYIGDPYSKWEQLKVLYIANKDFLSAPHVVPHKYLRPLNLLWQRSSKWLTWIFQKSLLSKCKHGNFTKILNGIGWPWSVRCNPSSEYYTDVFRNGKLESPQGCPVVDGTKGKLNPPSRDLRVGRAAPYRPVVSVLGFRRVEAVDRVL